MKKQVLFIVLMLMPLMASASTKINGIYYNLNSTDKVAEVTHDPNWTSKYTGNIVIPKTVVYGGETYSVTSIGLDAFSSCSGLTSITIPNSVTSIGGGAFYGCKGLTSMTIPNSVTSIGGGAFYGCKGLTSMTIPNSVTSIGGDAFNSCSSLTSVTIGNSVATIRAGAFSGCSALTSVTIPNSVTSIETESFYGCTGLTSIVVENGNPVYDSRNNCNAIVKTLTNELIAGCKSTIIPNSVTSIGDYAFLGCFSLTSVTIPNSVISIGEGAFFDCSSLTSVTIPNSVTSIGGYAFYCSALISVTIPNSVTSIERGAFWGCSALTSITIPNSVTSIGNEAFWGCSALTSITIPNSVTSIGDDAFGCCSALTSITIPNSVTSIGDDAFEECDSLTSVTIGKNVTSIGNYAFAGCNELKEVYCYANDVPTISNDTFKNSYYIKFATLYVPESSVDLYKASLWSQFGNIVGITGGNEGERCEKPVITLLANGKIKVESATEGATCVTNITSSNAEPLSDGEISLNTPLTVYTVTSYATKEGYNDSEVATATFRYEKAEGDMNGDGMLNITDVIRLVNMILGQ